MKLTIITGMFFLMLVLSLPRLGLATTFDGTLKKIEGSVIVVQDDRSGTERRVLIDQSTIKIGELKEGAVVVRNLTKREQRTVKIGEVVGAVKS